MRGFKSPATVTTNQVWVLPAADGSANQLLKTDGSGTLGWVGAGPGGDMIAANNLSQLTNMATARTNLDLGSLATESTVTSALITDGAIVCGTKNRFTLFLTAFQSKGSILVSRTT